MRRSTWPTLVLSVLFGATGPSCGDSGSGDDSGVNVYTGFPAEKKLSSFDDEDAKAACRSLSAGTRDLIADSELLRASCVAWAIDGTAQVNADKTEVTLDVAACNSAARQCQANPESAGIDEQEEEDDCDSAVANAQIMQCEATVSEYEACVSKILEQAKQGLASTTCENAETLIETDGAAIRPAPEKIPECKIFQDKCPTVKVAI